MKRLLAAAVLTAGLLVFANSSAAQATQPNPEHKVTICHAHPADSLTGPWVSITVDVASVGYQHQGHESEHDGDIIPAYSYVNVEGQTFSYAGKGNQAILESGCVALTTPTPTPTVTPTETPSPTPSCTEDMACWDCKTMGNEKCGPTWSPTWTPTWSPSGGATPGQHPLAHTGFDAGKAAAAAGILLTAGLGTLYAVRRRSA